MGDAGTIIKSYKDADETKRLHIYLECPELRERFMEIECGEHQVSALKPAVKTGSLLSRCLSFLSFGMETGRPLTGRCCLGTKGNNGT